VGRPCQTLNPRPRLKLRRCRGRSTCHDASSSSNIFVSLRTMGSPRLVSDETSSRVSRRNRKGTPHPLLGSSELQLRRLLQLLKHPHGTLKSSGTSKSKSLNFLDNPVASATTPPRTSPHASRPPPYDDTRDDDVLTKDFGDIP
jgi:hypothetical protein